MDLTGKLLSVSGRIGAVVCLELCRWRQVGLAVVRGGAWFLGNGEGDTMVIPGWIGNHGDVVEGSRSVEALVWEQWPLFGGCGFVP